MVSLLPSILAIAALLFTIIVPATANTEKVIFTAPDLVDIPIHKPLLRDLSLHLLTPNDNIVRTNLTRVFPIEPGNVATGAATWLLLNHLTPGQLYELRICWAAIQPTAFILDVYELDTVWNTPELLQSLATYADSLRSTIGNEQDRDTGLPEQPKASALLLQVRAAADYFTDYTPLMANPPPVLVDLILDPYLYNALPQSLIPTIGYLLMVGFFAWFVAKSIASKLQAIAITTESATKKQS